MATQLPIFPNATSLFVHSGNILNWDRLKKRPLQTPKDEVKIVISDFRIFKKPLLLHDVTLLGFYCGEFIFLHF